MVVAAVFVKEASPHRQHCWHVQSVGCERAYWDEAREAWPAGRVMQSAELDLSMICSPVIIRSLERQEGSRMVWMGWDGMGVGDDERV